MAKRENTNLTDIKTAKGTGGANIPVLSFAASENAPAFLSRENYRISHDDTELEFSAFYDSAHKLIFILDKSIDARTPNTLLIISPNREDPSRKWDDILANDYGLDLETIRPKLDNKYQKLDIEYTGLSAYNRLINAHNAGEDISDALEELSEFRENAAQRAALARLDGAIMTQRTATDTIDKAYASVRKLNEKIRILKEKLSAQKKKIGKEPTKQSAAKILKLESQIEAAREKTKRTQTRLKHAERRLEIADADADAARQLLGMNEQHNVHNTTQRPRSVATKPVKTARAEKLNFRPVTEEITEPEDQEYSFAPATPTAPATTEYAQEYEKEYEKETKVKPLVKEDPGIVDEKIAFRPIVFGMPADTARDEPKDDFDVYTTTSVSPDQDDKADNEFSREFEPSPAPKQTSPSPAASHIYDDGTPDSISDQPKNHINILPELAELSTHKPERVQPSDYARATDTQSSELDEPKQFLRPPMPAPNQNTKSDSYPTENTPPENKPEFDFIYTDDQTKASDTLIPDAPTETRHEQIIPPVTDTDADGAAVAPASTPDTQP